MRPGCLSLSLTRLSWSKDFHRSNSVLTLTCVLDTPATAVRRAAMLVSRELSCIEWQHWLRAGCGTGTFVQVVAVDMDVNNYTDFYAHVCLHVFCVDTDVDAATCNMCTYLRMAARKCTQTCMCVSEAGRRLEIEHYSTPIARIQSAAQRPCVEFDPQPMPERGRTPS